MDTSRHIELVRDAIRASGIDGNVGEAVYAVHALSVKGLLCTEVEREFIEARLRFIADPSAENNVASFNATEALRAERAGASRPTTPAALKAFADDDSHYRDDPRDARIAELEAKLVEATRPRKVTFVVERGGAEWVVWRNIENRRYGQSDRLERICGYNPDEEDAERHAREHAARLNAEKGGADA